MGFVKVVKNRSYFKRYKVKFRRRRECKTDYKQRTKLIAQDKNKYNTPKYRFVVRITNRDISCQIFSSDLTHDECIAAAYSHELRRYGLTVGLTNYSAAYCTGLLLARRIVTKFGMEETHQGSVEVDGDFFLTDTDSGAFKAFLDLGLARATTGANIFGALKGAVDGGLHIPHNTRRFPGNTQEGGDDGDSKTRVFSPEVHRGRIFSEHVAEYMRLLQDDEEKYKSQFRRYIDAGVEADDLEDLYTKVHAGIRADPNRKRGELERGCTKTREVPKGTSYPKKRFQRQKISVQQRKNRIKQVHAVMMKDV
uniref:Large ribosomal subunit protein uL18 n=2 Tax=Hirondellea gigas TaxID=1518452 RepID=A0A6A7FW81_9CRUS